MAEQDSTPVLDTLLDMTAASVARVNLDPAALMAIRLAALVAVDAPEASYLMNFGPAAEAGLTLEDAQSVLVAVAPIVGAPRVLSAAAKLADVLGIVVALAELAMEAELEEEEAEEEEAAGS